MNKKEAAQILSILKAGYPNHYKNLTQEDALGIVSMWSMQFADMSAEVVLMALNKAISVNKYPPTIAEVKEKIKSVHWEAYEMIEKHRNYNKLSAEELNAYKRIYDETQGYKFSNRIEPSISNMIIGKKEVKQITERNE